MVLSVFICIAKIPSKNSEGCFLFSLYNRLTFYAKTVIIFKKHKEALAC